MRHMKQDLPNSKDAIQTVNSSTFQQLVLCGSGPIVVEFMSYGCEHCRAIEPVYQQVANTLKAKQAFFRVNIALQQELKEAYEIHGTPTFILFLNGREVGRVEGLIPTESAVMTALRQPFES